MSDEQPIIKKVISTVGVKEAPSPTHNKFRSFALIVVVMTLLWAVYNDGRETDEITDIEEHIKPGTMMHQSIEELDDKMKLCYIKNIKGMVSANEKGKTKKIIRSIQVALIAGFISEYIVSGNLSEPLGIIGKTVLSTSIFTLAT